MSRYPAARTRGIKLQSLEKLWDDVAVMGVDRQNRDRLADTIERYLGDDLTALKLAEEIEQIEQDIDDPAVEHVCSQLWYLYDDCVDHKVVLNKAEWDYVYRLLLLLKSDAVLEIRERQYRSVTQLLASICLIIFGIGAFSLDTYELVVTVWVPVGLASVLLSYWRCRAFHRWSNLDCALLPFSSVREILAVRRRKSDFRKRRYPPNLATRRIRPIAGDVFYWIVGLFPLTAFGPVFLFAQLWPERVAKPRVELP